MLNECIGYQMRNRGQSAVRCHRARFHVLLVKVISNIMEILIMNVTICGWHRYGMHARTVYNR